MLSFVLCIYVGIQAEEHSYLESKNYVDMTKEDVSQDVEGFLQTCQRQSKNAFFNSGTYRFKNNLKLSSNVALIGDEQTIFEGTDNAYQSHILDDGGIQNIKIQNIVFDNMTIYSREQNSTNWTIEGNAFINARKVKTSIDSGLAPDSSNKNGGESTGYYILRKHQGIEITSNLFLRDENSLGRGIGLYKTTNAKIVDNYFGMLEDLDQSIVSNQTKALKSKVQGLLNNASNQGYFMTGINVISEDTNTCIQENYFSFNKNITEVGYEDGSQTTNGYHRDHFIYAKEYQGLDVVGNYFKGMNKNMDGGVKFRNGDDLFLYKNVFEDVMILLYIQAESAKNYLTNVYIKENQFVNLDFSSELINLYTDGVHTLNKYLTQDFLILFKNYVSQGVVENITIEDNQIYSLDLGNEEIRVDNTSYAMPTNLSFSNNKNALNKDLKTKIVNTQGVANQTIDGDYLQGHTYRKSIAAVYQSIDVDLLVARNEVAYEIKDKKMVAEGGSILCNQANYQNTELVLNETYHIVILKPTTKTIVVEDRSYTIPSFYMTIASIKLSVNLPQSIKMQMNQSFDLRDSTNFTTSSIQISQNAICTLENNKLIATQVGEADITISFGGFSKTVHVSVERPSTIEDFTVENVSAKLSENKDLQLRYDTTKPVQFQYQFDTSAIRFNEDTKTLSFLKTGAYTMVILETNSGISKEVSILIVPNVITYQVSKTSVKVEERFELTVYINGVVSEVFHIQGLQKDGTQYYATSVDEEIFVWESIDPSHRTKIALGIEHYYQFTAPFELQLVVGTKKGIQYTLKTSDTNYRISYEYDETILTVDDSGLVTPKQAGKTSIIIKINDQEVQTIQVEITKKTNYNYFIGILSGIILLTLTIFVILLLLKKGRKNK